MLSFLVYLNFFSYNLYNGFLFQIAGSQNRVYLTADNLVLNLQDEGFTR